jgi:hypothetical protein
MAAVCAFASPTATAAAAQTLAECGLAEALCLLLNSLSIHAAHHRSLLDEAALHPLGAVAEEASASAAPATTTDRADASSAVAVAAPREHLLRCVFECIGQLARHHAPAQLALFRGGAADAVCSMIGWPAEFAAVDWAAWPSLVARGDRQISGDVHDDNDDDHHRARVEDAVMRTAFEEAFERQLLSLQVCARFHSCSIQPML